MSKSYLPWTQDQPYLLPPSLRDWLPERHLAWFILDVVATLDLSPIAAAIEAKDSRGQRPYHPQMMVALLMYGYCTGVFSSRKLERACHEDVAFRVISANTQPHFTTINEFRRVHRDSFAKLFVSGLRLCQVAGLVKLGHVAIDGTKVQANASKHKAMSYERMCHEEVRLREEVERLLRQAETADAAEDAQHGPAQLERDLPEELARREQRLARIEQAKQALEAGARAQRAADLRAQAQGMEATARTHPDPTTQRQLRTRAHNARAQAEQLDPPDEDNPPPPAGGQEDPQALARKSTPTTTEGTPTPSAQRNFTDPDSSIMVGRDGFVQAYNCQLAVDEQTQIIVALGVTDQPPDAQHLLPMLHRIQANLDALPAHATADTGYWNPQAPDRARALGCEVLIATARTPHGQRHVATPAPEGAAARDDARAQMQARLATPEGRAVYARRKCIVEPVNGQIKHAQGFRRFSFRGFPAVDAEWNFVGLCHNILKLFRHRGTAKPMVPVPTG